MMFDSNNTIIKTDDNVQFQPVEENGAPVEMKKTKLVVPYVNLSVMPSLSFSRSFIA